jgi:hypothetical protein
MDITKFSQYFDDAPILIFLGVNSQLKKLYQYGCTGD